MLCILALSIGAFADGTSCSVRGTDGVQVVLQQENAKSNDYGCLKLWITKSEKTNKPVNVIVKVYDAYTDQVIKVESVTIDYNASVVYPQVCGLEANHPYYFRVSNAHCG